MNKLQDFLSQFRNGFQRPNRYVCQVIVSPTMVGNIVADSVARPAASGVVGQVLGVIQQAAALEDSLVSVPQVVSWLAQGYLVDSVRMPDRGFGTVDLSMYGITEHFPYHTEYSALECTFMMPYATNLNNDNAVPRFFSYWQNQIQHADLGPDSGFDFRFPGDYYATVLLTLLDRQNKGTLTYKFTNAYPKSVDSVPLSWAKNDKFASLPVTFNYSYWTIQPVAESLSLSLLNSII